jgi:uncharacterized protein YodC (DUF2158 family)
MHAQRCRFRPDQLTLVARGGEFQNPLEPELRIGDAVRLNSGGPRSLVVDLSDDQITIAWRDATGAACEHTFPRACVHRIRDDY